MKKLLTIALLASSVVSASFKSNHQNYSSSRCLTKISESDEQDGLILMNKHQKPNANLFLEDSIYNVNNNKVALKDSYLLNNWTTKNKTLGIVLYFNHSFSIDDIDRFRFNFLLQDYSDPSKVHHVSVDEVKGSEYFIEQFYDYAVLFQGDHVAISINTDMLGDQFILKGGLESGFFFEIQSNTIPDFKIDKSMLLVETSYVQLNNGDYNYLKPEYTRYGSSEVYLDGDVYDLTSNIDNPLSVEEIVSRVKAYDYGDKALVSTTYVDNGYQEALNSRTLGVYPIVFTATDSTSHTTFLTIKVHLSDIVKPTLKIKNEYKDSKGYLSIGVSKCGQVGSTIDLSSYFEIEDNFDTSPTFVEVPKITYSSIGTQVINVKTKDSSNNVYEEDVTVRIYDDIAPTINGKDSWDLSLSEYASSNELLSFYTINDNVNVASISITDDTFTGSSSKLGTYHFTINVKDDEGNLTTKVVTINVIDEAGPVFFINEIDLILEDDDGYKDASTMLQYLIDNKYISSSYTNAEYVTEEYDKNYYNPGSYKVIIKCRNAYGNKEYISINLTIKESIKTNTDTAIVQPNFFVRVGTWTVQAFVAIGNFFVTIINYIFSWFK